MIRIECVESLACPFIVCDVCGRRILDLEGAMAAWSEAIEDDPASVTPAHLHKHECLDAFESRMPAAHALMTDELIDHLRNLLDNSGYPVAQAEQRRIRQMREWRA